MTDLTPEDIAAAREEGDLVALLVAAAGLRISVPRRQTSAPEPDVVHIAHPGAWPTGARRPAPIPPIDGLAIGVALADYRHWIVADRPHASTKCPCSGCTPGGIT